MTLDSSKSDHIVMSFEEEFVLQQETTLESVANHKILEVIRQLRIKSQGSCFIVSGSSLAMQIHWAQTWIRKWDKRPWVQSPSHYSNEAVSQ